MHIKKSRGEIRSEIKPAQPFRQALRLSVCGLQVGSQFSRLRLLATR